MTSFVRFEPVANEPSSRRALMVAMAPPDPVFEIVMVSSSIEPGTERVRVVVTGGAFGMLESGGRNNSSNLGIAVDGDVALGTAAPMGPSAAWMTAVPVPGVPVKSKVGVIENESSAVGLDAESLN